MGPSAAYRVVPVFAMGMLLAPFASADIVGIQSAQTLRTKAPFEDFGCNRRERRIESAECCSWSMRPWFIKASKIFSFKIAGAAGAARCTAAIFSLHKRSHERAAQIPTPVGGFYGAITS